MLPNFYVDEVIKRALAEDINYIDITTDLLIDPAAKSHAKLIAKDNGILAGIDVALRVFEFMDSNTEFNVLIKDGEPIKKGDIIAEMYGSTNSILKSERTALNILQHMSGIATYTRLCVDAVADTDVSIADTRKTLPGLRALQKYAVLCGGGNNHRFNLSTAAMIKDNHINAYGSITEAINVLKERAGHMVIIEIEVSDLDQLREAIEAGAVIIMLDNMSLEMMKEAAEITAGRAILEISGGVTLENIREIAKTGIYIISIGALTHSAKNFDISLKIESLS
jgi:nicotinate-nucleotide pyrophosphorylase (carboxylating)